MADQRLPIVDGDDGEWGEILNQYVEKEHYNTGTNNAANGGHKTITIRPGTASAGTAPLKFNSGTLLTSPEAGAMEFYGDRLYQTVTTGAVRKTIAMYDDSSGATGDIYYRDSSGNFTRLGIGSTDQVLKVAGGLPVWGSAGGGGTPGGSNGNVQYNDAGVLSGSTFFNYDPSSSPNLYVKSEDDSYTTFRVEARFTQSANLQEWTDSTSAPLLAVDPFGVLVFGGDSNLYRVGAQELAVDSSFLITSGLPLSFAGSVSGLVEIQPAAAAGTYSLTLPTDAGGSGEYLKTDGSGVLSWDTPAGGGGGVAPDSDQNIIAVGVFS